MEILLPFHRTVLWMYAKLKEIYLLVATDQIDQIGSSSTYVGYVVGRSSIPIHVHNKQIQYLYTKLNPSPDKKTLNFRYVLVSNILAVTKLNSS